MGKKNKILKDNAINFLANDNKKDNKWETFLSKEQMKDREFMRDLVAHPMATGADNRLVPVKSLYEAKRDRDITRELLKDQLVKK